MSTVTEKDLEAGAVSDANHSSSKVADKHPFPSTNILVRSLPETQREQLRRLHELWHTPIPFPAPIERRLAAIRYTWAHPLQPYLSETTNARFEVWWLAPEHVWMRRRLRYTIALTAWFYFWIIWCLGLEILPFEMRRDIRKMWEDKVGEDGCSGTRCITAAIEIARYYTG